MAQIRLSFDDRFREMMLNCTKLVTTRPVKQGEPGDVFEAFDREFEIARVLERKLYHCALNYEIEGFGFYSSFADFWRQVYGWWEPERIVYQHWFVPL